MIAQGKNEVIVEGLLSEISLELKEYEDKTNGTKREALAGFIKVLVDETIEGNPEKLEVRVNFFANKLKNDGGINPSFTSVDKVRTEFKSVAAVGEDEADYVRVNGANISMNEYYNQEDKLVSFPQIRGSFVNRVKREDVVPRATWELDLYINKMQPITDKDGVETGGLIVTGINVGYGERAEVISVKTNQEEIAKAIESSYEIGETVPMSGKVKFSSTTEEVLEEVEIGDPIKSYKTINVSDLIITGVRRAKEEGYTTEEIKTVIDKRMARLEEAKNRAKKNSSAKTQNTSASKSASLELGF